MDRPEPAARPNWCGTEPGPDYWLRVWAARGLLWAWDESALTCIMNALDDEAWRVREMALKVVARHRLTEAVGVVARMRDDPASRVAKAADRAWARVAEDRAAGDGSL